MHRCCLSHSIRISAGRAVVFGQLADTLQVPGVESLTQNPSPIGSSQKIFRLLAALLSLSLRASSQDTFDESKKSGQE